jgi:hypothetical protein
MGMCMQAKKSVQKSVTPPKSIKISSVKPVKGTTRVK